MTPSRKVEPAPEANDQKTDTQSEEMLQLKKSTYFMKDDIDREYSDPGVFCSDLLDEVNHPDDKENYDPCGLRQWKRRASDSAQTDSEEYVFQFDDSDLEAYKESGDEELVDASHALRADEGKPKYGSRVACKHELPGSNGMTPPETYRVAWYLEDSYHSDPEEEGEECRGTAEARAKRWFMVPEDV